MASSSSICENCSPGHEATEPELLSDFLIEAIELLGGLRFGGKVEDFGGMDLELGRHFIGSDPRVQAGVPGASGGVLLV